MPSLRLHGRVAFTSSHPTRSGGRERKGRKSFQRGPGGEDRGAGRENVVHQGRTARYLSAAHEPHPAAVGAAANRVASPPQWSAQRADHRSPGHEPDAASEDDGRVDAVPNRSGRRPRHGNECRCVCREELGHRRHEWFRRSEHPPVLEHVHEFPRGTSMLERSEGKQITADRRRESPRERCRTFAAEPVGSEHAAHRADHAATVGRGCDRNRSRYVPSSQDWR